MTISRSNMNLSRKYLGAFMVLNLSIPEQRIESFSLTILEGMSAGCPCVVPPVGGHLDYFRETAGLLAHARDYEKIIGFIDHLKRNKASWRKFSNSARLIAKHYSSSTYNASASEFISSFLRNQLLDLKCRDYQ